MENLKKLWWPKKRHLSNINSIVKKHRIGVEKNLLPLVNAYYPVLVTKHSGEYRKMIELTTKMTMVGRACTEIAGYPFDERRLKISSLFGACCFLADSFIDDFGEEASKEYIERFELLLTKGWFEIRTKREGLFYIIVSRIFAERDVLDTIVRQAIFWQFMAQKRDIGLRIGLLRFSKLSHSKKLNLLRECSRDKGGCVASVLSLLLVPEIPLRYRHLFYMAGMLFQYIDDYGDYHYDRYYNRMTYMNQVRYPSGTLRRILYKYIQILHEGLPGCMGRDILLTFLLRYFVTRLEKHRLEQYRGEYSWTIYE
ncbi:MAG: hypothetical protein AABZ11_00980 [Nitrospinota bacterium]